MTEAACKGHSAFEQCVSGMPFFFGGCMQLHKSDWIMELRREGRAQVNEAACKRPKLLARLEKV